jgi:agmatinase
MALTEGIFNFGGLTPEMRRAARPRYSVLPVPYDLTASYISGMRNGPRAIVEASTHMELYDEELGREPYEAGIETLQPIEPTAIGPAEMIRKVRAAAAGILDEGKIPVVLGGEHSITLGVVEALVERHPDLSVLQLDAHADMRDEYQDTPFNHACVARRISEICPIVQAGIRSLSVEEAEFLASRRGKSGRAGIKTFYAQEVMGGRGIARIARALTRRVFITIDLDVFDPSVMPATGTPEPGGLSWYDVIGILREVIYGKEVAGFDVVELCPLPGNIAPDFLAARLVYKMMGYINAALSPKRRPGRA